MALSKSSRIIILLVIDSVFFLLELVTGYTVHSLALVADSFHMLNDVLSLCVGLWAVKMANKTEHSRMYTYGYQRAETLGALVNGVFLVALCVTIFLDAIQRFVEPQEVSNPVLVLIVGCLGLASNLVGLVLFHDVGHSHGGGGHDHSHGESENTDRVTEEGHAGHNHSHEHPHSSAVAQVEHTHSGSVKKGGDDEIERQETGGSDSTRTAIEFAEDTITSPSRKGTRRHSRSTSRGFLPEDFSGPSAFRNSIIAASQMPQLDSDEGETLSDDAASPSQNQPLLSLHGRKNSYGTNKRKSFDHKHHKHAQPKEASKDSHGHSHGDLNMRGIFLHVMGDALGNIGVIATALIIWLTSWKGRFYCDPAISLVITCIILTSAIPLCKAASRILLQAVPQGIEVDDVRADIEDLQGVESCHHLHVWQLSDTKLIASLHVRVTFNFKGQGSQRYMQLASAIRECLHEYGIHSSTIQPEFHSDSEVGNSEHGSHDNPSRTGSVRGDQLCLLECGDDCGNGKSCCPPAGTDSHSPNDGHDHSH